MLVLTPKYSSLIDIDLIKKQKKEPLIKHRYDVINLNIYSIKDAYLAFLDNKDTKGKYVIGYKPKDAEEINGFVKSLGKIDTLDVSWIDVSELDSLLRCFYDSKTRHIIGLEKWDVSNVEDMGGMFTYCQLLENIGDISGWDVSNVEDMPGMFYNCKKLESIDISRWDVSNVEYMNSMFYGCEKLKSIDISGWIVSKAENMGCMFSFCQNLGNIGDLSRWDVSTVTNMYGMFLGCQNLKYVGDLEQWNVLRKVLTGHMFDYSAITQIPSWYKK